MSVESSYKNGVLTTLTAYATPTAPVYYGELSFSVEKVHPVFWPGNTIAGKFEPEMDMRISLLLIANYNSGKTHITQGPVVVTEAKIMQGKHIFELIIPDNINGQTLPMSFRDDHVQVEYRLVGFDLTSNEQLKGYLPIQIMTPVIIDEDDFRVMKIEKRLKTFGLFETGGIKMGIRVNNPELRPGEDLSIKLVYSVGGGSKKKKLKKISLALYQRVAYNMAKDATNALFAPLKNTQIYKVKQHIKAEASEKDEEIRVPLSISLPPLLPSTPKVGHATFGNYVRVSYYVKLKVSTGSHHSAWEIPIHVGTTAAAALQGCCRSSGMDIDYAILRRDDCNEHSNMYGIIFTKITTPWPTENDTEKLTLELSKVNSPQATEHSALSLQAVTQASILTPCEYSESQMVTGDEASTMTSRSINNSLQSYLLAHSQASQQQLQQHPHHQQHCEVHTG